MESLSLFVSNNKFLANLLLGVLIVAGGYGLGGFWYAAQEAKALRQELEINRQFANAEAQALAETKKHLEETEDAKADLERQVEEADDKINELEKITRTDPELLQKYSKVFFLNEHYTPERLRVIDPKYLSQPTKEEKIHSNISSDLRRLIDRAEDDGIVLQVASAYRSFEMQTALKSGYKVVYGSGANQFSADQGYSEHQLGTTVDFTTPGLNGSLNGFEKTEAYKWLQENAYRYGFVLSYPPGNKYYQFEPWHWRFVGIDLARDLHKDQKYFYDLDQREINEYLGKFFD